MYNLSKQRATYLTGVPYKKDGVLGEIWGSTFALNWLTKNKLYN